MDSENEGRPPGVGEVVVGAVKSVTDFGIFIGLDGGIDGLVHLSDIKWNEAGEEAVRRFKKGDPVAVQIDSFNDKGTCAFVSVCTNIEL